MTWVHPDEAYDATVLTREQEAEVLDRAQVLDALRSAIADAGSTRSFARRHALGEKFLSDILAGRRPPSAPVLTALKIHRCYVRTV